MARIKFYNKETNKWEYADNMKSLTFIGAVDATYDGSEEVTVEIPSDEHINSLINTALGVIENGTY